MQEKMNCILLTAPDKLEYTQVDKPEAKAFEVLCRVESVSICGTDPHIIHGHFPGHWPQAFPLIPGHEWSGVVEELGPKAEHFGWEIGDRVCGIANVGCGYCKNCQEGRFTICLNYGKQTVHSMYGHITTGAYAQYMAANIKSIAKIPDDMSHDIACMMDPMSIALHMTMHSGLEPGDSVLVNGAGAQGWMAILCARAMGAGQILCAGSGKRLEMAQKLGATPIDYRQEDVLAAVQRYTGGLGVKRVLEATGTANGVRTACFAAARGGCVSVIGFPHEDVPVPVKRLVMDEISLVGNRANPNTLDKAISIAQNFKEELGMLVTHIFPLSEYQKALELFESRAENSLKVVVKPHM